MFITKEALKSLLEEAFAQGWLQSGQGFNAEHHQMDELELEGLRNSCVAPILRKAVGGATTAARRGVKLVDVPDGARLEVGAHSLSMTHAQRDRVLFHLIVDLLPRMHGDEAKFSDGNGLVLATLRRAPQGGQ